MLEGCATFGADAAFVACEVVAAFVAVARMIRSSPAKNGPQASSKESNGGPITGVKDEDLEYLTREFRN
jgi:hypothetical protein